MGCKANSDSHGIKTNLANDFTVPLKGQLGQNNPGNFEMQKLFSMGFAAYVTKL